MELNGVKHFIDKKTDYKFDKGVVWLFCSLCFGCTGVLNELVTQSK